MPKKVYTSLDEMFILENLITQGRDNFELRYSANADLIGLTESRVGNFIKAEITEWCFVTLEDVRDDGKAHTFLTGMKSDITATMTSDVVAYNPDRNLVFTKSGSLYYLSGKPAEPPLNTPRVAAIAATMNGWGIGLALGMPLAFF